MCQVRKICTNTDKVKWQTPTSIFAMSLIIPSVIKSLKTTGKALRHINLLTEKLRLCPVSNNTRSELLSQSTTFCERKKLISLWVCNEEASIQSWNMSANHWASNWFYRIFKIILCNVKMSVQTHARHIQTHAAPISYSSWCWMYKKHLSCLEKRQIGC